ncbi:hypothetical protein ES707_21133 [subsurface metagenome]
MWYNGDMDTYSWANPITIATLILAFVTVLLAIAAFWAIWQNYSFRKKDRKRLIKERALIVVRNWVKEAVELMMLNAKYESEHNKTGFNFGRTTLENIQIAKGKLLREYEETLISAKFWTDLFDLVDEVSNMLEKFIEDGMAENPKLPDQYRENYIKKFVDITALTREIERKDPDFTI